MPADGVTSPQLLATCDGLRTCPRVYVEAGTEGDVIVQGDQMPADDLRTLPLPVATHETAVRIPREILLEAAEKLLRRTQQS